MRGKTKDYYARAVENKRKLIQFLGVINFYLFGIINRRAAHLSSRNICPSLTLLEQVSKIRTALTRGQERNMRKSQRMHIRKKMRIREFVGQSEYFNCQKCLWE
jgi:hypothetical protein